MATPLRLLVFIILWSASACGHVVDPPPEPPRVPFVEAALIAGATTTTVRAGWLDSERLSSGVSAPATLVDLTLTDETTGASIRLTRHDDTLYLATLAIRPGHRYRLAGRIEAATIHATTTVPEQFVIEAPVGDSIMLDSASPTSLTTAVGYRWRALGATAFVVDSAWFPPGQTATRAPIGQMIVPHRPAGAPARLLRIVAVNRDLDEYLYRTPAPASNVFGGFGVVGAAISAERRLVTR